MDPRQFDRLAKTLGTSGTRRALLRLVAVLPGVGALLAVLDDTSEAGRRSTRANRHGETHRPRVGDERKGKGKRKKRRKKPAGCTPQSSAQTCAGRCGSVPNNCGTIVDCGACACPVVCPVCQKCNTTVG